MSTRISRLAARKLTQCRNNASMPMKRQFTVLAIETSADDTCAAVVDSDRKIHSNIVMKQHDIHEAYGGIYPMSAIGSHQHDLPFAVRRALDESELDLAKDIDGIAFTRGPGMPGCLSVGMNAAKTLAAAMGKPLVGVNHMVLSYSTKIPFLTLLISGGHTLLLLATSVNSFKLLATTADESIGRSFDKVSKLLQLKWTKLGPGDALEKFCAEDSEGKCPSIPPLPRPMPKRLAFSYSALHSHVKLFIESLGGSESLDIPMKKSIARAFQTAAVGHLEDKLVLALEWCKHQNIDIQSIVVSGGVASNMFLRQRLRERLIEYDKETPYSLIFPPPYLCTDNAVMIAWASMHRFLANDTDKYNIDLRPKWSIEDL
ncbi:glycoprotease family-domain-containing protein [Pholiota molesta]|nr:glycoprotease family-domain-containing protein [Pholiota molesta]